MLLIGSAGRNSGKTEFACSLLRRWAPRETVVGVKVTTVRRKDGTCPRGGKGCGVCSSLEGEYSITEETCADSGKDTARLLAAGADRVFWLRVMRAHLLQGVSALIELIGDGAVSVCESNSLRSVIQPGVFLMVREDGSDTYKASAQAVRDLVDRTVVSDGRAFDIDLSDIRLVNGRWTLREHATAVVLAGGASRRMQRDKTLLDVRGRPLIEHVCAQLGPCFDEVLVSANDAAKYRFLGARVVADQEPGLGPMMGIVSALDASSRELNVAVACDIPDIDMSLVHRMLDGAEGYDAVVPRTGNELLEPLFAVYRKSTADVMRRLLAQGERRPSRLFEHCRTRFIDLPRPLRNLNTMQEYRNYVETAHADV
jgi:molybdenum cofactor guanylyltransferase